MREAPTIYLFTLRALFEENPEVKEELRHNYQRACGFGTDKMLMMVDTDLFRPGVDIGMLLAKIDSCLFHCLWQMFSAGKLDPASLEKDFMKRIG